MHPFSTYWAVNVTIKVGGTTVLATFLKIVYAGLLFTVVSQTSIQVRDFDNHASAKIASTHTESIVGMPLQNQDPESAVLKCQPRPEIS